MLRSADDAMLSPFYNTLADELGGDEGAKALRVKDYLKRDYMKTRLAEQFELTQGQMDGILQKAGASTAWRRTLESRAGGTFAVTECPSSVRLMCDQGAVVNQNSVTAKGEVCHVIGNTLSEELGKEIVKTIVVPWCVLFCADISNPSTWNGEPQGKFTELMNEFGAWVWCMWNPPAFSKPHGR